MRSLPAQALKYTVWPRAARRVSGQAVVEVVGELVVACAHVGVTLGTSTAAPNSVRDWRRLNRFMKSSGSVAQKA